MRFDRCRPFANALAVVMLCVPTAPAQEPPGEQLELPAPTTYDDLGQRIGEVLDETGTPGIGIAIVSREETLWATGIGVADVASGRAATADTLFRIGSTSKGFVSLAVLKLREQGKLRLDDTLKSLAPEIEFENRWEETDPVRLVHLLEHTSGFDDIHLIEFASNDPKPLTLREGLDLHPHSRISRWRPGRSMSYCNSGPAIAAYIVEKVTGRRFEDYVQEMFFDPLGMSHATYFLTPEVERMGATLYRNDGVTPNDYWHISTRSTGAINASAREMASYVRMYLGRGSFDGAKILSPESIERMETPESSWAAREGLEDGYALGNYTDVEDGYVYYGHNGGVNGGATEMSYLPDHGLGYVFMINTGNSDTFARISSLVRSFLTSELTPPEKPPAVTVPADVAARFTGFYQPTSPRQQVSQFLDRIVGVARLRIEGERLILSPAMGGEPREFVAVSDRLARADDEPISSLALLSGDDGTYLQTGQTWKKIPVWLAWGQIALTLSIFGVMGSAVVFALIWVPRWIFGKLRGAPHLGARLWPLAGVIAFLGFLSLFAIGLSDPLVRLGSLSIFSVGQWILGMLFTVLAFLGLFVTLRVRSADLNRMAYGHSLLVACASVTAAVYLLYWGMIGLRTWSF